MSVATSLDGKHLKAELCLLLACARVGTAQEKQAAIQHLLADELDWTVFAQKVVGHGMASFTARTLVRLAPDDVPPDLLDAFHAIIDDTSRRSVAQFEELVRILEALGKSGIEAIPFKGPVLAVEAFGRIALRESRDLDFLVRDADLPPTIATLSNLGYRRDADLTAAQLELIHRVQGQEILFGEGGGTAVEPHTRLTSLRMALDIDYDALWRRARRADINGHSFLTLDPEDTVLLLAIHGGKEMWWSLKWAGDFAAYVGSHPDLDWASIAERARAQGCLRILLLATLLCRQYLYAPIPDSIIALERADRVIGPMVDRIAQNWQADEPSFAPNNSTVSLDRLRLHDGIVRQASYVMRTVFLPGPHHVAAMPLPAQLTFAYTPIRLAHDLIGLPIWRLYQSIRAHFERLPYALASFGLPLAVILASSETRLHIKQHRQLQSDAMQALATNPDSAAAWRDLGDALFGLKRYKKAVTCFDKALKFVPYNSGIWRRRSAAMLAAGAVVDDAQEPQDAEAWAIRAENLIDARRYEETVEATDQALALDPNHINAARIGIQARLCACDWSRRDADERRVAEGINARQPIIRPFYHRGMSDSEAESLIIARVSARGFLKPRPAFWSGELYSHDRIRVAYSSTDFRDHVVSDVMVGCFEHHDRSRFDLTAISLGPDDGSGTRKRVADAFDRFIDVRTMSDVAVARLLREQEIDLIIDLNGSSGDWRPGIFAHRPVPVQAGFLGYPGTTGLPFMDYIIADRIVIPPEHQAHYAEHVVYLPNTYMPCDGTRPVSTATLSRVDAGLPPTGFVFACHNHDYKLGPEIFDIWMRLLRKIDGSVLWLRSLNPTAMINLRREASARGVAAERLIFAPRVARAEDHLARLRLADLCLDTRPYNAHATACDALWVGLPVLTCPGNTYSARAAASMLLAIGMPELVTTSLVEYEAMAAALAQEPKRLAAIKAKLTRNRETEPLFDTARFTRNLEAAYIAMWERQQRGLPPERFGVNEAAAGAIAVASAS